MSKETVTLLSLFRLSQISDSAFPVGSFSFSLGLEAAVAEGIVGCKESLEAYTRGALHWVAQCDGIALLEAFRAAEDGDYNRLREADHRLFAFKTAEESRAMTTKMGKRLAELLHSIAPNRLTLRLLEWIESGEIAGCYPTLQAASGVVLGTGEKAVFAAHLYGVASTLLSAALRLMRLSHFESQQILYSVGPLCQSLYDHYSEMTLSQMSSFAPTLELCTSLHERGKNRLFMS